MFEEIIGNDFYNLIYIQVNFKKKIYLFFLKRKTGAKILYKLAVVNNIQYVQNLVRLMRVLECEIETAITN